LALRAALAALVTVSRRAPMVRAASSAPRRRVTPGTRSPNVGYPASRLLFTAAIDLRAGRPAIVG